MRELGARVITFEVQRVITTGFLMEKLMTLGNWIVSRWCIGRGNYCGVTAIRALIGKGSVKSRIVELQY
jgi:hypothetical protein